MKYFKRFIKALLPKFAIVLEKRDKFFVKKNPLKKKLAAPERMLNSNLEQVNCVLKNKDPLCEDHLSFFSVTVFDGKDIPGKKCELYE